MIDGRLGPAALRHHLDELAPALRSLEGQLPLIEAWGCELAERLLAGARLLAAGNGGSAAHAQHLTAELVGRYRRDRPPFSAIALHAEASALTAIANDYGFEETFARQVGAHGRPGDVLVAISTSGRSPNVLAAVDQARMGGLTAWALTGPGPNPLAERCHQHLAVSASSTATVQEVHQIVVHLLCEAFDGALPLARSNGPDPAGARQAVRRR